MGARDDAIHWADEAACASTSGDWFFPDAENPIRGRVTAALAVCAACPVRADCLGDALATGDNQFGIRGGLFPEERRAMLRRMA